MESYEVEKEAILKSFDDEREEEKEERIKGIGMKKWNKEKNGKHEEWGR